MRFIHGSCRPLSLGTREHVFVPFLSKVTQTLVGNFNVPQMPNNSRWQLLILSSRETMPSNRKTLCNIMDTFDLVRQVEASGERLAPSFSV